MQSSTKFFNNCKREFIRKYLHCRSISIINLYATQWRLFKQFMNLQEVCNGKTLDSMLYNEISKDILGISSEKIGEN